MKHRLRSLLLLSLLLGLGLPLTTHADPTAPMFAGSTLTIHGETFVWNSATEDGTWHYDTYISGSSAQSVLVTGVIGFPDLATVTGSSAQGSVDGHLNLGSYGDNHTSGAENGYWVVDGSTFQHREFDWSYAPDLVSGQLLAEGWETYRINDTYYYQTNDYWQNFSGESGWSRSGGGTGQSSWHGSTSYSVLETTYNFSGNTYWWVDNSAGAYQGAGEETYTSAEGGWITLHYDNDANHSSQSISGWDPYFGSFQSEVAGDLANWATVSLATRTAPSFAPAQLWVNGTLLNWQWGELGMNGVVTDHYSQDGWDLVITAQARGFMVGSSSASVTVNGSGAGTYTASSGFSNDQGHTILTSEPSPDPDPNPAPGPQPTTSSSPFFTSATSLWVDGTEYPFAEGYEDGYGNRTDTYVNASAGTVTLAGSTSDVNAASVSVSYYGSIDYGYYYGGGTFQTYSYSISTAPPAEPEPGPEPVCGPPAFWVRGQFYVRTATDSNQFETLADAGSPSGPVHALSVSSVDGGGSLQISGNDSLGYFSGSMSPSQTGVHLMANEAVAGTTVVVIPANADGTLQLGGESPPQDFPPALRVTDERIWVFLGTASEDTAPGLTAAYYGSATAAQASPWLLKLRTDGSGSVIYTDYSTGSSTTGTYSATSHLFQTSAPDNGFPVPVNGVDPNDNHRLWGLQEPPAGLPATFLVGGQVWRYSGTDGNGAALYQGYYDGQILVLGAAGPDGLRLVTVTDPVHGSTQGTLNDVRGSVRLRDGRVVYSGSFEGQQINPVLNENNLHTIAADLDITGNVLSFGALQGDAAVAGVTLQFADADGVGTLYSALGRPQAQWVWSRVAGSTSQTTLPVMKLDAFNRLTLHTPGGNAAPGIVLDPQPGGVSTFNGTLRVRPGGDIDMGEFTHGPMP